MVVEDTRKKADNGLKSPELGTTKSLKTRVCI